MGAGGCGVVRDAVIQGDGADFAGVLDRGGTLGGVHHQLDFAVFQHVHHVWPAFIDLFDDFAVNAVAFEKTRRPLGGDQIKAEVDHDLCRFHQLCGFVCVLDGKEHAPCGGQHRARPHLRLEESAGEVAVPAHDFAGRPHFRTQDRVDTGEAGKGQHRLFHAEPRHVRVCQCHRVAQRQHVIITGINSIRRAHREVAQRFPRHDTGRNGRDRAVGRLGHKGHSTRGARVHLDQENFAILDGKLHVHQANNIQRQRQGVCLFLDLFNDVVRQRIGW